MCTLDLIKCLKQIKSNQTDQITEIVPYVHTYILGDPDVSANLYCDSRTSVL